MGLYFVNLQTNEIPEPLSKSTFHHLIYPLHCMKNGIHRF